MSDEDGVLPSKNIFLQMMRSAAPLRREKAQSYCACSNGTVCRAEPKSQTQVTNLEPVKVWDMGQHDPIDSLTQYGRVPCARPTFLYGIASAFTLSAHSFWRFRKAAQCSAGTRCAARALEASV